MPVRSTTRDKLAKRRRSRGADVSPPRAHPGDETLGERRDRDPSQDTAVYNCHCGMVFEAPVNTSVGCPHCGGQQAW